MIYGPKEDGVIHTVTLFWKGSWPQNKKISIMHIYKLSLVWINGWAWISLMLSHQMQQNISWSVTLEERRAVLSTYAVQCLTLEKKKRIKNISSKGYNQEPREQQWEGKNCTKKQNWTSSLKAAIKSLPLLSVSVFSFPKFLLPTLML